jgi:glutamate N-acetyltransferase / amino-acid N-acetyltransferase
MIPKGFTFSAINAGIKNPDYQGLDLGLIWCSTQAVLSGVFTQNLVKAAPVIIGMEQVKKGISRGIIANAGNANACTGQQGIMDAHAIMNAVAQQLDVDADVIFPMSTGTIGVMMPMERISPKIPNLVLGLSDDAEGFARSIMTTDTFPKIVKRRAGEACVLGFAKGAGMIAPNMATTLAIVLTDAIINKHHLDFIINNNIFKTFNAITIDGDMSTNDSLAVLASGLVAADLKDIETAIVDVLRELAQLIVRDGEGATKFVTIHVTGTDNDFEARAIAMAVCNSMLVKTALFGADPNWGRIVAAVGYAGVPINPFYISVAINKIKIVENSMESPGFDEESLHKALEDKNIAIEISVGKGQGAFTAWTTDLSYRYVEINAQYRT